MKSLLSLILLTASLQVFATVEIDLTQSFEDRSFEVSNTKGEFVDVAIQSDSFALPKVVVVGEYGGFECTVKSISRTKVTRAEDGTVSTNFLVLLDWSPGNDQSGCQISVTHPSTGKQAILSLYMSY